MGFQSERRGRGQRSRKNARTRQRERKARRFISHLNLSVDFCGENASGPSWVPVQPDHDKAKESFEMRSGSGRSETRLGANDFPRRVRAITVLRCVEDAFELAGRGMRARRFTGRESVWRARHRDRLNRPGIARHIRLRSSRSERCQHTEWLGFKRCADRTTRMRP